MLFRWRNFFWQLTHEFFIAFSHKFVVDFIRNSPLFFFMNSSGNLSRYSSKSSARNSSRDCFNNSSRNFFCKSRWNCSQNKLLQKTLDRPLLQFLEEILYKFSKIPLGIPHQIPPQFFLAIPYNVHLWASLKFFLKIS